MIEINNTDKIKTSSLNSIYNGRNVHLLTGKYLCKIKNHAYNFYLERIFHKTSTTDLLEYYFYYSFHTDT